MSRRVERRMLIGLVGHGEDYDPGVETPARITKDYLVLGFLLSLLLCPAAVLWAQSPPSKVIGPGTDQGIVPGASGTVGTPALSAVGPNTKKRNSSDKEIQHHFQSAKSHHEQQRLLEAMLEYQEVLQVDPQHERASISLAMLLSQMGRKKQAEDICREQLRRYPTLIKLHLTLASLLIPEQRYQEASREIEAFFEAAGKIAEVAHERTYALYLQGISLIGQNREEEGVQRLLEVVKLEPRYVEAHMELAEFYSHSGQTYEKAVQHLSLAVELRPDLPLAHENLGKVLLHLDRIQPAVQHLQRSIELNPAFYPAYFDLAKAYRKLGQPDKAKEILSRFEALHSEIQSQMEKRKRALALYQDGERHSSQGRFDEALRAFQECQQLAPERSQFDSIFPPDRAYYGLAFVNLSQGHFQVALKDIEKAIKLYPYDPRYYEAYARTLDTLRDPLTAITMIKKAIQLNPSQHSYYNFLGNLCSNTEKYQEAVSAYRRAAEMEPKNPYYRWNLSSALLKVECYAESQKEKELFLKLIAEGQK